MLSTTLAWCHKGLHVEHDSGLVPVVYTIVEHDSGLLPVVYTTASQCHWQFYFL